MFMALKTLKKYVKKYDQKISKYALKTIRYER